MSDSEAPAERPDILKLEEEISNFFEDIMYDRGGSPLLGRIYALCVLAASTKPLLQKDLVTKFNVNPSTISRNLKELETWGLIDRRREPGSREWNYQIDPTSFLELLVNRFEQNAVTLRERGDDLKRIRDHWGRTLSEESKQIEKGKRFIHVLDFLIEWITIVDSELESFIQSLQKRFFELERQIENRL